ncbi:hypothetical protein HBI56_122580 [Parastagonospora nodorum]|uniref:BTB domain-containing protein n=2 Tax=Phaeosphaeria nodorum (strain SN15 / ATCC MYA-4574 / FGSC 10173) TaxID=321614 RepID=A0A7U2I540_PHANO|nr:hypothetical protein SNOG_05128 [Parastagonospora nodorum SN15]KAH3917079.1 hypothetical protein HBH56_052100 [Parastagonospora nodorum]EAT87519.1 hypothetical protein SNOG_05128 [Parastagonospora nodorum SN15]KAH3935363.1 hypothetical protein HBH54_037890 [Parastagonospora nodorum]KAH3969995.1 hypothetical protein HBH51_117850 [Parastagonospora nodorum]KAH3988646.1 hypothetical protein HBH52_026600 [Parastagonospora nodorum]
MVVSDTIIVRVGDERKDYTLHKRLLIHHSEYFRGALSGNFRETNDGVITLEDIATEYFDVFVDWLYEKEIPKIKPSALGKGQNSTLLRTYVLADRFMVFGLKNAILKFLFDMNEHGRMVPTYATITYAFQNLTEHDPLLQFIVDMFCVNNAIDSCSPEFENTDQLRQVPQEAFARIFVKMRAIKGMAKEEKKLKRSAYKV